MTPLLRKYLFTSIFNRIRPVRKLNRNRLSIEPLECRVVPGFAGPQAFNIGTSSSNFVIGDFDGNGAQDLLLPSQAGFAFSRGTGTGAFLAAVDATPGVNIVHAATPIYQTADINADGKLDIVDCVSSYLNVLLGNGDGTFRSVAPVNLPYANNGSFAVADINGDGRPDLVSANKQSPGFWGYDYYIPPSGFNGASVLLGNGDGTFQSPISNVFGSGGNSFLVADVTGDGKPDLLAMDWYVSSNRLVSHGTISTLRGDGHGVFAKINQLNVDGELNGINLGDHNQDGRIDIILQTTKYQIFGGFTQSTSTYVFLNQDGVNFQALAPFSSTVSSSFMLKDVDANGTPDIVSVAGSGITIHSGLGDGTFAPARVLPIGSVTVIGIADVTGDGKVDIVLGADNHFVTVINNEAIGSFVDYKYDSIQNITSADINGDSRQDLIGVVTSGLAIRLGNGDGTFRSSTVSLSDTLFGFVIADLNRDGKPDLVVRTAQYTDDGDYTNFMLMAMLGYGNGTFSNPIALGSTAINTSMHVTDINHDGNLDLIGGDIAAGNIVIMLGNGDGTFRSPGVLPLGPYAFSRITVTDVNTDGSDDLIVQAFYPSTVTILLGNGDGTFRQIPAINNANITGDLRATEVNGDGYVDLIAAANWPTGLDQSLIVMLGNGDGTFQIGRLWDAGIVATDFLVEDANHDGLPDILTFSAWTTQFSVMYGHGDGSFQAPEFYTLEYSNYSATLDDFTSDSIPDLLTANGFMYSLWRGIDRPSRLVSNGEVGVPYSASLMPRTDDPSLSATLIGRLPDGLVMDSTGHLSGIPTNQGTYTFTVSFLLRNGSTVMDRFDLSIMPQLSLQLDYSQTSNLPDWETGDASLYGPSYDQIIRTVGGNGSGAITVENIINNSGLAISGSGTSLISITGIATSPGTVSFTLVPSDLFGQHAPRTYSFTVYPEQILTPATLTAARVGVAYTQTFSAIGGKVTPLVQIVPLGWIPWLKINNNGTSSPIISGTPTQAGTYMLRARVYDGLFYRNYTFTLFVEPGVLLSNLNPPDAQTSIDYNQIFTAIGVGNSSITISSLSETLGLIITGEGTDTIQISGAPTHTGIVSFILTAIDSAGHVSQAIYTIKVVPPIVFSLEVLPDAILRASYNQTISVTGGSGYLSLQVDIPINTTGLWLSGFGSNELTIGGIAGQLGELYLVLTATDSDGNTVRKEYRILVLNFSSDPLPNAYIGYAYQRYISATDVYGSNAVLTIVSESTVPGLAVVNVGTGYVVVGGTATATGTESFTIRATDRYGSHVDKPYSFQVVPPLEFSPSGYLPNGEIGLNYSRTISASGGYGPIVMHVNSMGGIPGITITGEGTSTISFIGEPTQSGYYTIWISALDALGDNILSAQTISIYSRLTLPPISLPDQEVNIGFSQSISTTGGIGLVQYSLSDIHTVQNLPILSGFYGFVSFGGVPLSEGLVSFTVTATDLLGATSQMTYTFNVISPMVIAPERVHDAVVGIPYSQIVSVTGGTGSPILTIGNVQNTLGLTITGNGTSTLEISGTPSREGYVFFTVYGTDSIGSTQSRTIYIQTVVLPPSDLLPLAEVGIPYNQRIVSHGGTGPLSLQVSEISNLSGLALSGIGSYAITISGTPTIAGDVSFFVTPSDANGVMPGRRYTFSVRPAPTFSTLPHAEVGFPYSGAVFVLGGSGSWNSLTLTNFNAGGTGLLTPTINRASGTVTFSGTPTHSGTVSFSLSVVDNLGGQITQIMTIPVAEAPQFTLTNLPNGDEGKFYNQSIGVTGGSGQISFIWSNMLNTAGLTLLLGSDNFLHISGTPSQGILTFTLVATDDLHRSISNQYSITILSSTPALASTQLIAGILYDTAQDVVFDAVGNSYVTGTISSPITGNDAFVSAYNPAGALLWTTLLGGSNSDAGQGIAVDATGVYVVGWTASENFPHTEGLQAFGGGTIDSFVVKLSLQGVILSSTFLGGISDEWGYGIVVDSHHSIYLAGTTFGYFPTTTNASQPIFGGIEDDTADAFVMKLNSALQPLWATFLGGADDDGALSITLDASEHLYVSGYTASTDFPMAGTIPVGFIGSYNAFVAKYDTLTGSLIVSRYIGGAGVDEANSIAVDTAGNVYVAGYTTSNNIPVTNGLQAYGGDVDGFVIKIDASLTNVIYATYLGGSNADTINALTIDAWGNLFVTGLSTGNFPIKNAGESSYRGGETDGFMMKLDATGQVAYATYLGGNNFDWGNGIAVSLTGAVKVVGYTQSSNFMDLATTGNGDGFVTTFTN